MDCYEENISTEQQKEEEQARFSQPHEDGGRQKDHLAPQG